MKIGTWSRMLLLGLWACQSSVTQETEAKKLEWVSGEGFRVRGIEATARQDLLTRLSDRKQRELFEVHVDGASTAPPIMGAYEISDEFLWFRPRFPLREGLTYRASFKGLSDLVVGVPRAKRERTRISAIYPSTNELPENALRFYLHFTSPMTQGHSYDHISIIDDEGSVVIDPFLEIGEELWDPKGERLTLLIHPGRIKSGLLPREELGPVFEEGRSYELRVDSNWLDAYGVPLQESMSKSFQVSKADYVSPDPKRWSIHAPREGTCMPVLVRLDESVDHALLERLVWVQERHGDAVLGTIEVEKGEANWKLIPDDPWRAGDFELVVGTELEDLAGNNLLNLFEVDVFNKVETARRESRRYFPFTVLAKQN